MKVDLSKYVEMHQFAFDNTLDEAVTNDQVSCSLRAHASRLLDMGTVLKVKHNLLGLP